MNVVAAIIERNGRVLICQRKAGQRFGGKWEFPGGKVEPDEELESALARELDEELDIRAIIGEEVARYLYTYPARDPIQLIFYAVREFEGEPENRIFERIVWETPANLPSYDFLEGDVEFVKRFAADRATAAPEAGGTPPRAPN
jgi:mutator protein MutT